MSSSNWFYSSNGQQHGPISAAQLKQFAASGELGPDDLVCQEGSEQWVAASRLNGLFSSPQPAPPAPEQPETLPQIQINVGKTLKGIGTTVQGVAESQPVKDAAATVQNVAGQAAAGVGNFVRSDAVQSQVAAANNFWSNLSTQHKVIAASVAGCGLLIMFCVVGTIGSWMLGIGDGSGSSSGSSSQSPRSQSSNTSDAYQEGYESGVVAAESIYTHWSKGDSGQKKYWKDAARQQLSEYEADLQKNLDLLHKLRTPAEVESHMFTQRMRGMCAGFRSISRKIGVD